MSETSTKHKAEAPSSVKVLVVTCSTSKYHEQKSGRKVKDTSGDLVTEMLENAGHAVYGRKLIPDNEEMIRQTIVDALSIKELNSIIITGGTGVSGKDLTIEVVKPLMEKELPGFGELLRALSYREIGSSAIMTRATAGVSRGKAIFCLPGSPDAVRKAVGSLIIPEVTHIVKHAAES